MLTKTTTALLRRARTNVLQVARRSFATHDDFEEDETLYEIRTYQLKPEHLMDYLALTGSEAFHPRTDASKLCAFFNVEMGSVLCNSVVHFWKYDSLDHRTEVRASLASDEGFGNYINTIRPWLVSQEAVLTRGFLDEDFIEKAAAGTGKYMLQSFATDEEEDDEDDDEDEDEEPVAEEVGAFDTVIGDTTTSYKLVRGPTFQHLLDFSDTTLDVHDSVLLVPTPFSPAQ